MSGTYYVEKGKPVMFTRKSQSITLFQRIEVTSNTYYRPQTLIQKSKSLLKAALGQKAK